MRMLLLVLTLLTAATAQKALAADITMTQCNENVAELNANLPMQLDGITSWVSTTCEDKVSSVINLVYGNEVADGNAITQAHLIKLLLEGDYTCQELADETGLHYVTVLQYTRELYRAGAAYIVRWDKTNCIRF